MKLSDMSAEYRYSVRLLSRRIGQLRMVRRRTRDEQGRRALTERIRILEGIRRETGELALLTAEYYRRGAPRQTEGACPRRKLPL